MTRWQAIVFDLDDTLYPERSYVLSGFKAVSQWAEKALKISAKQGFNQLISLYESGIRGNTFNRWLENYNLNNKKIILELIAVYRNHTPNIEPFVGVLELLSSLEGKYSLGLISDGFLHVQQQKLAFLGLEKYLL